MDTDSVWVAPSAPTGLEAKIGKSVGIELTWNPNSEVDLLGYNVFRRESSGAKYLTTGIYFAKFEASDYKEVKKLILIK